MSKKEFASFSLPVTEIERLREIASKEHRSMSGQVVFWMEQHLQSQQKVQGSNG